MIIETYNEKTQHENNKSDKCRKHVIAQVIFI